MPDGVWTNKTDMPLPLRDDLAGSRIGDVTGYAFCGYDESNNELRDNDEYNKTGNFWTSKAEIPLPERHKVSAATIGADKAYVFGGGNYEQDNDEYSQSGNSWINRTDLGTPGRRSTAAMALGSDEAYLMGGVKSGPGEVIFDNDEYSQTGNSWTDKTVLPSPARMWAAAFAINDVGYIAGGFESPSESGSPIGDTDAYLQSGDSWTNKADTPSPTRGMSGGASLVGTSKGYFVTGKQSGGNAPVDCDEYYPVTDLWAAKTDLVFPGRFAPAAVALSDWDFYLFGGTETSGSQPLVDCDEFHMPRVPWVENLDPPHAQTDVPVDTNISFDLKDDAGVDVDTITVKIGVDFAIINGVFQAGFTGTITTI